MYKDKRVVRGPQRWLVLIQHSLGCITRSNLDEGRRGEENVTKRKCGAAGDRGDKVKRRSRERAKLADRHQSPFLDRLSTCLLPRRASTVTPRCTLSPSTSSPRRSSKTFRPRRTTWTSPTCRATSTSSSTLVGRHSCPFLKPCFAHAVRISSLRRWLPQPHER